MSSGPKPTSVFDITAFKTKNFAGKDERQGLVFMARTAETAERYEDMCKIMRELVLFTGKNEQELTVEERNLLSVAYKNVIGSRRAAWRTLNAGVDEGKFDDLVVAYRKQVEGELSDVCLDVLDLLENTLVKNNTKENEARVFYLKMTGDYYRYLAEFVTDKQYESKAADFYKQAQEISTKVLDATHPIRLGLALNYSVCFYEILVSATHDTTAPALRCLPPLPRLAHSKLARPVCASLLLTEGEKCGAVAPPHRPAFCPA